MLSDGPTLSKEEMEEAAAAEHSLELYQGAQEVLDHQSMLKISKKVSDSI